MLTFQVFNLNAPVPPATETEALNQASQYQNSYSQGFSNQSPLSAEASEMQSEQLQSGEPNGSHLLFSFKFECVNVDVFLSLWPAVVDGPVLIECPVVSRSRCLPFSRPGRWPAAGLAAGSRVQPAGAVLLQQQGHGSRWTPQRQGHDERLQRLLQWFQR